MKHVILILLLGFGLPACSPENENQKKTVETNTAEAVPEIDSVKRKTRKDGVQLEEPDTGLIPKQPAN